MPIVYRCKSCGYVLHYLRYVGQDFLGVPSVYEVLGKYGYTCPKCKSKLRPPSQEDILIASARSASAMGLLPVKVGAGYYVVREAAAPQLLAAVPEKAALTLEG